MPRLSPRQGSAKLQGKAEGDRSISGQRCFFLEFGAQGQRGLRIRAFGVRRRAAFGVEVFDMDMGVSCPNVWSSFPTLAGFSV